MQELKELDYGGLILYSAGLILVLIGFTWAEGTYPWKSAHVIASLVVGVLTIIAFVLYEAYMPLKQPLLPLRLFKHSNLVAVIFVGSIGQMVYYALNVLFPQQLSALYTLDNILVGLTSVSRRLFVGLLYRSFLSWRSLSHTTIEHKLLTVGRSSALQYIPTSLESRYAC